MKLAFVLCLIALPLVAQELWENPVRKLLREGKPVIGATVTVASADVAGSLANMGFDFLWIEMEHSPITLETARNMVLATRGLKAVPFIRVPVNELWTAKRALDAGALGVVFPFTSTPELAKQAADSTKYPPNGRRGSGPGLPSLRWPAPEGYADFADRNVMTIIIIEEARAVEKIDEIAATKARRASRRNPRTDPAIHGRRLHLLPRPQRTQSSPQRRRKPVESSRQNRFRQQRKAPLLSHLRQTNLVFDLIDLVFKILGRRPARLGRL
jgi:hypothetical protein